jgi:hypothetical protein
MTMLRLAGWSGVLGAALLLTATARRLGLVPDVTLTHAIAPPASALALLTLTGLYFWQRDRLGGLGLAGYALNLLGLAGLFAVEFTTQLVLPYADRATRDALLAGPPRTAFGVVALVFLAGVVLFGVACLRAGVLPVPAVALYMLGFATAALRGIVPDPFYNGALVIGAVAVLWLSGLLIRTSTATLTPDAA